MALRDGIKRVKGVITPAKRPSTNTAPETLEDRLEAKVKAGDCATFSGPSLDELSREQRHKILYGA